MFAVVLFRSFAHQPRVDHKKIAGPIVLQELDRATHHVWQARLFAARFDLVGKRQFAGTKDA
jgi:hypothetical protein